MFSRKTAQFRNTLPRGFSFADKTLLYRRTYTHCRSPHTPALTRVRPGHPQTPPQWTWKHVKSFWSSPVPPTPGLFCGTVIRRMVPAPPQTPSSHVLRRSAVLCSPLIGLEHARACAQGPGAALHVRRAAVFTRRAAPFSTTMLMLPSLAHLTKLSTSSELATAALDAQHERQKRPCAAARPRVFAAEWAQGSPAAVRYCRVWLPAHPAAVEVNPV